MKPVAKLRWRRWGRRLGIALGLGMALLYVPDCDGTPELPQGRAFAWNQDDAWAELEQRFVRARAEQDCAGSDDLDARLDALEGAAPDDRRWDAWESAFFDAAARAAACDDASFVELWGRARARIRATALAWDLSAAVARRRLYRLLQGGRMATEEVMLQMPAAQMPVVVRGPPVASAGPCTELHDTRVCSGDILLSRGGAPTSALIARGSDYPGSFSHVALVHVDDEGTFRTIEAHIEVGVVVAGLDRYEGDPKLRVMLLRPRPEALPHPRAPRRAAEGALEDARARHIAYDFAMDYRDPAEQFCSEVASANYAAQDVHLWRSLTSMSAEGTARWLAAFGVRSFETHGPSDLEHDPQLAVVAEWRDPEALLKAHVDDAVVDALLEGAERGDEVDYAYARLPLARLAKAYSWVAQRFGAEGPIPEGMSATVALRVEWLRDRHAAIATEVLAEVDRFRETNGYTPPYWELVDLAREAR